CISALSRLGAAPLVLPVRDRKTRHDPPAKSKIGRVNMPPAVDPAEFFVLMERYQHYRQTVHALRLEFGSEVRRKAHEARAGAMEEADEHRELMAWKQLRIARLRQEAGEQEQWQAEEQARKAEEARTWAQLKEREVLPLQEEAKNFITRENLEARVEAALDFPKSYNWAITREGLVVRPQRRGS
uniref:Small ribosomal subunit protein mS26 n=1 Tax=Cebus imitator TaxID=2715852 RepID=A0A2K5RS97_CEBIM